MMRTAVSENRRTAHVSLRLVTGGRSNARQCPGVTEPAASLARTRARRLHRFCFKVAVSQARSAIAAAAAAAACSARAATSAASRAESSTGSNGDCCEPGVVSEGPVEYAAPSSDRQPAVAAPPVVPRIKQRRARSRRPRRCRLCRRRRRRSSNRSSRPPEIEGRAATAATVRQTRRRARRAIKPAAQTPVPGSRGGPSTLPRTTVSTPEPTSRSAQALAHPVARVIPASPTTRTRSITCRRSICPAK